MSDAMLQKTIDLVSSMEAKNETQQLAKYELIEYTERLHEENQKYKEVIDKAIEYINSYDDGCYTDSTCKYKVAELNITKLLDILKESD